MTADLTPAPDLGAWLDAAEAREQRAHAEVVRLCEGGRWTMRVPVDEDRDSDTVIEASLADVPRLTAALRAVEALADERDRHHFDYCCTRGCVHPDSQHPDPDDPVTLDELCGAWGENPPPLREHRTLPCPGTCTCPVGRDVAELRSTLTAALASERTTP